MAEVKALLIDVRLLEEDGDNVKLLPAAFRYQVTTVKTTDTYSDLTDGTTESPPEPTQDSLW